MKLRMALGLCADVWPLPWHWFGGPNTRYFEAQLGKASKVKLEEGKAQEGCQGGGGTNSQYVDCPEAICYK